MKSRNLLTALVAVLAASFSYAAPAAAERRVPLKLYWSSARTDNFTTSTSQGARDARVARYRYVRVTAYVLAHPAPGTKPLKLFWSRSRRDNFTTATLQGARDARAAGYRYVRVMGYVYTRPRPGTVPLKLFWSRSRRDNFTTATEQGARDARAAGYRYVRIMGYVPTSPTASHTNRGIPAQKPYRGPPPRPPRVTHTRPPIKTQPPLPGGGVRVSWSYSPRSYRGRNGLRKTVLCSPGGSSRTVWGSGTYTDDSSVCTAAVHAGVISFGSGGRVTFQISGGLGRYSGSRRHGVSTRNYGSWGGSFRIVGGSRGAGAGATNKSGKAMIHQFISPPHRVSRPQGDNSCISSMGAENAFSATMRSRFPQYLVSAKSGTWRVTCFSHRSYSAAIRKRKQLINRYSRDTVKHTVNTYFQYRVSRARCTNHHTTKFYVCIGSIVISP